MCVGVVFQYLLRVPLGVWQLCGHVEHDLFIAIVAVDGFCAGLAMSHVQATTESNTHTRTHTRTHTYAHTH